MQEHNIVSVKFSRRYFVQDLKMNQFIEHVYWAIDAN